MLALLEVSINIILLAVIVLAAAAVGFLISKASSKKQKSVILKLEVEMLRNHAEILQLHKELTEKENLQSSTPIFSIRDSGSELSDEQLSSARLSKRKISGGGKSTS
ncbi:MAG: hypothetical protein ABIQ88_04785 [Chitinophagaceae bacterium]